MSTRQPLMTATQIATVLGEHEQTVRKHTRAGRYPFAVNVGGTGRQARWRYDPRGLEKWLQSRTTTAA